MENSAISWTDNSWNPWIGCVKVSPGCDHCYAEGQAKYRGWATWGRNTDRKMMAESNWRKPLAWNRKAATGGVRTRVFCASLADVFEDHPQVVDARKRLWDLIAATPHLDWLLLTKRPGNVKRLAPYGSNWPENIWLGTSVENQQWADIRIPKLLEIPAKVRFLSCEPLLGPVDLREYMNLTDTNEMTDERWETHRWGYDSGNGGFLAAGQHSDLYDPQPGIHWVICGGESGPKHRPMDLAWSRSLRDQCASAGVPFFFKQIGGITSKSGGHLLDGEEYYQLPPE